MTEKPNFQKIIKNSRNQSWSFRYSQAIQKVEGPRIEKSKKSSFYKFSPGGRGSSISHVGVGSFYLHHGAHGAPGPPLGSLGTQVQRAQGP